mmetsp:Transcript_44301/g.131203  ORF Transcript_44301/g.131203 Transcript_44301/m.131203 type:complete len:209 (+) Transcript_44301:323-949(+)
MSFQSAVLTKAHCFFCFSSTLVVQKQRLKTIQAARSDISAPSAKSATVCSMRAKPTRLSSKPCFSRRGLKKLSTALAMQSTTSLKTLELCCRLSTSVWSQESPATSWRRGAWRDLRSSTCASRTRLTRRVRSAGDVCQPSGAPHCALSLLRIWAFLSGSSSAKEAEGRRNASASEKVSEPDVITLGVDHDSRVRACLLGRQASRWSPA